MYAGQHVAAQPLCSPGYTDGKVPTWAAVIQRVSMLNTETAAALVTNHLQHLLPAPLF